MSEIRVEDIKVGDRVTIYRTAESIFAAGLYVSGVALDHGTGSLFVWSEKFVTSTKVSNETTRRIVSHTPAVEQLAEPEPAWEKARALRTPKGILCRDPKSGWWIDHEGGQWSSSDVDDMDDVTVVVDAEGRNVAADAVTHLLRKTEDEKHAAESQIADLIRQRETALRDLRKAQRKLANAETQEARATYCYSVPDGMDGYCIHASGCPSVGRSWSGPNYDCVRKGRP